MWEVIDRVDGTKFAMIGSWCLPQLLQSCDMSKDLGGYLYTNTKMQQNVIDII